MCIIDIILGGTTNATKNCDSLHSLGIHYTGSEDLIRFHSMESKILDLRKRILCKTAPTSFEDKKGLSLNFRFETAPSRYKSCRKRKARLAANSTNQEVNSITRWYLQL